MFEDKIKRIEHSLSYDDILIKPAQSAVIPSEVDISLKLEENITLSIPVFSAAMDTVTGYEMARSIIKCGGCAPLHKNVSSEENVVLIKKLLEEFGSDKPIAISIGVGNTFEEIDRFVESGANVMVVDSAHGHSENVGNLVEYISNKHPNIFLIAGNIVTSEGAKFLIDKGAKAVKVGIGPGSICTTRKVTGIGRGQVSAIAEVASFCHDKGIIVIADGGMKSSDEIMKSIACGADAVMLGYMFAGCDECPGEFLDIEGEKYKLYRGMGSLSAMKSGSSGRYNKDVLSNCKWVPEGIESYVKAKGSVKEVLHVIEWSLKSAFGYLGARNLKEAKEKSELVRISKAGFKRSDVHSISKVIPTQ
ncbi:inosine-5'-monophosphate dehydrogenase [Mycoplasma haemocanis str. Illinois]|uniref:Inosine-5'-monophosphate dehydrogenase n=1 Tax=Mycoplasma haemocanis (strain Illinois) TaxID=1111676 RepID=H6N5F5_MYCHN|nr:IMP dehydrogenase [Mycoplasma haemocanis]AEW44915.1 inosine-5'-monophosphate dehydrogenase [Mycoplasma haemocanis str. Illinois]